MTRAPGPEPSPAVVAACCLLAVTAIAPDAARAEPDEIVVTGRALPRPPGADAYSTVVIDREALLAESSGRLEAALGRAGLDAFRRADARTAHPTAQGVTVRGLGGAASSRVLVLLDGVPQADLFAGWIPWPALDPEGLASVTVTRGGGAGSFGSGALAGVVELQSAGSGDAGAFSARAAAGSSGATAVSARTSVAAGDGEVSLGVRHDRSDGRYLTSDAQRGAADRKSAYEQSGWSLRWIAPLRDGVEAQTVLRQSLDRRIRGLPGTQSFTLGIDASARVVGRGPLPFEALAYLQDRSFRSRFATTDAARTTATPTLDQYDTPARGWGGKLEVRPTAATRLGLDARGAEGETRERFRFEAGRFTRDRRAGGRSVVAGVYLEQALEAGDLTLTGGVRLDRWRLDRGRSLEAVLQTGEAVADRRFDARDGAEASTRAGLVWRPAPPLRLRSAAYAGWRPPTLNELYRPFRVGADVTSANALLEPERLAGVEGGFEVAAAPGVRLSGTIFRNRLRDPIVNRTRGVGPGVFPEVGFVAAGGVWRRRENADVLTSTGVELQASVDRPSWGLDLAATVLDAELRARGSDLDGRRPAQTPRAQASAAWRWTPVPDVGLSAALRWSGERYEDDLETRPLASAVTLDLAARRTVWPGVEVELRGENLFDARVEAGVSGSGVVELAQRREIWLGLRLRR